jgi:hypothetical protein
MLPYVHLTSQTRDNFIGPTLWNLDEVGDS